MEVKILNSLKTFDLERRIVEMSGRGFELIGPVTVGVNPQGNTIFIATMKREAK